MSNSYKTGKTPVFYGGFHATQPGIDPMIKNIATVGVYVDDQKKALQFWTEKVGFDLRNNIDMGNGMTWMEVAPKGADSYPRKLMTNFAELKPSIVFVCENIEKFCADLKTNGVVFSKELAELGWGKFASFQDEDGNEFGLKGVTRRQPAK